MILSGGRRLLLLDLPQLFQPGASGLISADDALVVLWPLLLLLPRILQSWAHHGLVTASLHHHRLLVLAVSLLLHCLLLFAAVSLHNGPVHLISSLHHHVNTRNNRTGTPRGMGSHFMSCSWFWLPDILLDRHSLYKSYTCP